MMGKISQYFPSLPLLLLPPILLYLPGFPDYGFYSTTSDQRGPPFSFADYGSLGPQAAQLLQSEHATSACNSPLQHLPSPDQYKSPGVYHLSFIHWLIWFMWLIHDSVIHSNGRQKKKCKGHIERSPLLCLTWTACWFELVHTLFDPFLFCPWQCISVVYELRYMG